MENFGLWGRKSGARLKNNQVIKKRERCGFDRRSLSALSLGPDHGHIRRIYFDCGFVFTGLGKCACKDSFAGHLNCVGVTRMKDCDYKRTGYFVRIVDGLRAF